MQNDPSMQHRYALLLLTALWPAMSYAANSSLASICSVSALQAALPPSGFLNGITIDASSVTANAVYNQSYTDEDFYPNADITYCNVTFQYSHAGIHDNVVVQYWLPSPEKFQNRYLSTGGGAYQIFSGSTSLAGGIPYGAVSGGTDGGFGSFDASFDDLFLIANGTVNWQNTYMFAYQAHHELSLLGKEFTRGVYNMANGTKLYSYYQACSEGGREGFSQVQRFPGEWDGAIIGAPALRFAFQQANHLFSPLVEVTMDYYPTPCALEKLVNLTIAACDPLDGRTDGVVARTDLCQLQYNMSSAIGESYYCAASSGGGGGPTKRQMGGGSTPAQNGTINSQDVAVASAVIDGLHDSAGRRAYLSYRIAAAFSDATPTYDSTTGTYTQSPGGIGGEWIERFLNFYNSSSLPSWDGITYDTLTAAMLQGLQFYQDSLNVNWPDLTGWRDAGSKILHFHGESDPSIPTGSSVHYYESVRNVLYPDLSFNESQQKLNPWYKLFLVPGMAHCAPNDLQPNGPFPQTNMAVMIDWVERGIEPVTLNATHLEGPYAGQNQQICGWPLRPYWSENGTKLDCVSQDQASLGTWLLDFDAYDYPVY
ncbi:Feruloyl esterase [Teratosphaeria destructans]|uniref:Carboxylic ester hydrolase n=1 Tax=Teratosphaeria destructans TaxID=418781 RepID=A0A9W7STY8_9PEZI|nr:Feruloyl esterase [Teratosphaeria destructans]